MNPLIKMKEIERHYRGYDGTDLVPKNVYRQVVTAMKRMIPVLEKCGGRHTPHYGGKKNCLFCEAKRILEEMEI